MISSLHSLAPENCIKLLIGNKTDLAEMREVSYLEGQALANKYGFGFYEVSSIADKKQVYQVFIEIGKRFLIRAAGSPDQPRGQPLPEKRTRLHKVQDFLNTFHLMFKTNIFQIASLNLDNWLTRGLGFGVWGLGFGVWGLG